MNVYPIAIYPAQEETDRLSVALSRGRVDCVCNLRKNSDWSTGATIILSGDQHGHPIRIGRLCDQAIADAFSFHSN